MHQICIEHAVVCVVRQIIPRCETTEFGVSLIVMWWIGTRLLRIFTNPIWALFPLVTYIHKQQKRRRDTYNIFGYTKKKNLEFWYFRGGDYLNYCVLVSDPTDVSEKTAPSISRLVWKVGKKCVRTINKSASGYKVPHPRIEQSLKN